MAGFSRSAFTVAAAGLLLGSPGLVGAASADDCERSARTQATVSEQSQAAQQVLADLGWQVHDIDEDDDGEVSIEARQGGQEVDVNIEPLAKGEVDIEVEVDRTGKKGARGGAKGDDARACRAAEEILGRITRG